ncbi:hypothetical protein RKD52_000528 [Metabacillus sp. SLBN-84]
MKKIRFAKNNDTGCGQCFFVGFFLKFASLVYLNGNPMSEKQWEGHKNSWIVPFSEGKPELGPKQSFKFKSPVDCSGRNLTPAG